MKWFQHSVDSHDDPDISDAIDKFGDAGYSVFFILLELFGREFDNVNNDNSLDLSLTFVRRKLRKSSTKVQQILNFYSERQRIFFIIDGDMLTLTIPKFVKKSDNWTRRKKKDRPPKLRSNYGATPYIEAEVEVEVEVEVSGKPDLHFSKAIKKRVSEIETACQVIETLPQKIDKFNSYAWVQFWSNKNGHPDAMLETLKELIKYWKTIKTPWAYANKTMDKKNKNYNEADFVKQSEKFKTAWQADSKVQGLIGNMFEGLQ
ncbi:MAG: DUF4373 domain-containing protein [FCB group bacterium]|nr:DUF4373 domain-containing protein [FCB group bacterium]